MKNRKLTNKRERFIKFRYFNVFIPLKRLFSRLRNLHFRILDMSESDLEKSVDRNPYQILFDWFIDVLSIGFVCIVPYIAFIGWRGLFRSVLLLFGLGMLPTVIRQFRKPFIET